MTDFIQPYLSTLGRNVAVDIDPGGVSGEHPTIEELVGSLAVAETTVETDQSSVETDLSVIVDRATEQTPPPSRSQSSPPVVDEAVVFDTPRRDFNVTSSDEYDFVSYIHVMASFHFEALLCNCVCACMCA